jgi:hypothetical protein
MTGQRWQYRGRPGQFRGPGRRIGGRRVGGYPRGQVTAQARGSSRPAWACLFLVVCAAALLAGVWAHRAGIIVPSLCGCAGFGVYLAGHRAAVRRNAVTANWRPGRRG